MTLPCTLTDMQKASYLECDGKVTKRVKVCQEAGETIKVEVTDDGDGGTVINTYTAITSVATATKVDLVTYTVPVGKTFFLKEIEVSGDSVAEFFVEFDATENAKKRIWYNHWNEEFLFYNQLFTAGQVIKVRVEHCSDTAGNFEGRIIGNEK